MTFDDWWDTTKPADTPETLAGWERSCRQAWDAALKFNGDLDRLDRFEEWLADRAGPLLHIDQIKAALQ